MGLSETPKPTDAETDGNQLLDSASSIKSFSSHSVSGSSISLIEPKRRNSSSSSVIILSLLVGAFCVGGEGDVGGSAETTCIGVSVILLGTGLVSKPPRLMISRFPKFETKEEGSFMV